MRHGIMFKKAIFRNPFSAYKDRQVQRPNPAKIKRNIHAISIDASGFNAVKISLTVGRKSARKCVNNSDTGIADI